MQINFLPGPSPVRRFKLIVFLSLAAILLLANVSLGISWAIAKIQLRQQETILKDTNRQIAAMNEAFEQKTRLIQQAQQYQVLTDWSDSRPDIRSVLGLLSTLLPRNSFITQVEFLGGQQYYFRAVLPNMESVSTYLRELGANPIIQDENVLRVARSDSGKSNGRTGVYEMDLQITITRDH